MKTNRHFLTLKLLLASQQNNLKMQSRKIKENKIKDTLTAKNYGSNIGRVQLQEISRYQQ